MSVSLSTIFNGYQSFLPNGLPNAGGAIYTYIAGTSTPAATYTNNGGAITNANPIPLSIGGTPPNAIWITDGIAYKFVVVDAFGAQVPNGTFDNVTGSGSSSSSLRSDLAASTGALLLGFIQAGVGAMFRWVQDKLRERVTPQDFMTAAQIADALTGNPVLDHSGAIQKAVNTGKAVDLGDASQTYLVLTPITYTGKVHIRAKGATVKSDVKLLRVTDGSGSRVRGINILPVTTPYTVTRNPDTWAPSAVAQTLAGYMPTTQDADIWAGLPANVKAQFDNFDPRGIYFDVSSAAGGRDIEISGITGSQVTITLEGYSDSAVFGCNFGARREGIVYRNALAALNGVFTLPRGQNNRTRKNTIKYAAQCGLLLMGQDYFDDDGTTSHDNGESGIKTAQHDGTTGAEVICTHCKTVNYIIYNNYHDGVDWQSVYGIPGPGDYNTYNTIGTGSSYKNRHTGLTINGRYNNIIGPNVAKNGSHGANVQGKHSTVTGVMASENSAHPEIHTTFQIFDILVQGDGHSSTGNYVFNPLAPSTWNYLHSGEAGVAPSASLEGIDIGNRCSHGAARMFVSPNIPSSETLLIGGGTRNLTNNAAAVIRQGGGGVDMGGASNTGYVRIRGEAANAAQIDFTTNATDPAGGTPFQGRILHDFVNNLFRFLVNGGTNSLYFQSGTGLYPSPDNTLSLGAATLRWSQVYAGSATISTSDADEKQQEQDIDAAALRAWAKVKFRQFKFNDAVELKGDGARWHFGVIAQQVKAAFESEGLDPFAFGVLCYDEWDAAPARYSVNEETGEQVEVSEAIAAGNRYGIRYEEALVLECAYLRSRIATPEG